MTIFDDVTYDVIMISFADLPGKFEFLRSSKFEKDK